MGRPVGILEGLARTELEELIESIAAAYRPGSVDRLSARDPAWRQALDRAEVEVGSLYEALREADVALARWRRAMAALSALWLRVREVTADPDGDEARRLGEVA